MAIVKSTSARQGKCDFFPRKLVPRWGYLQDWAFLIHASNTEGFGQWHLERTLFKWTNESRENNVTDPYPNGPKSSHFR